MSQLLKPPSDGISRERGRSRVHEPLIGNFVASNPVPGKAAMAAMGMLRATYRCRCCPPRNARQILKVLGDIACSGCGEERGWPAATSARGRSGVSD